MTQETETAAFLAHYGVKGMRWGVVKKEDAAPKQVSEKKQAKRDKKAKKYETQAAGYDTHMKQLKALNLPPKQNAKAIKSLEKEKARALDDAQRAQEGRLTSDQKRMIIGGAIVVGLIALKAGEVYVQSGEFNRQVMKGQKDFDLNMAFKKKSDLASKDLDADQVWNSVAKKVNPEYGALGTKMNCRRCTFAYELRRRGYDVEATRTTTAHGQNAVGLLNALSPGEKIRRTGTYDASKQILKEQQGNGGEITALLSGFGAGARKSISDPGAKGIFQALSKEPDGSRGELGVMWKQGGGHSMAYEIIKGKAVIFDAQTGKRYMSSHEFDMDTVQAGFTRLDNLNLNTDYLLRWLKNAK